MRRRGIRKRGGATYRLIRYADDFVVMVYGTRGHAETLREEVSEVLAPVGLRLSEAKTHVVHLDEGFDFLGRRIQRGRKRGVLVPLGNCCLSRADVPRVRRHPVGEAYDGLAAAADISASGEVWSRTGWPYWPGRLGSRGWTHCWPGSWSRDRALHPVGSHGVGSEQRY